MRNTAIAAAIVAGGLALAGCGTTISKAPVAAPRSSAAACQKLAAWERSSSSGSVADDASLQSQIAAVAPPRLAGDFYGWIQAIKAGSGDFAAHANAVRSDCAAAGVPDVLNGGVPLSASAPAPSPSSSAPLSGSIGTTFTVTGGNGPDGATTVYDVTLDQVDQHATLSQYGSLTNGSDHVTAAEFRIDGSSGQASDDADNDAVAVGTDGQDYTPAFDTITEGTNFDAGDFRVSPGQDVTGWISFELPAGVSIESVQWAPTFGGSAATWNIGG